MSTFTPRLLAIAALGALTLAAAPAQAALVGLWDFENTLNDVSGNANHGTGFNSPTFVADVPGALGGSTRSLSFSGAAHVVIANEGNFDLGANISVSTWVKGGLPGTWDPFISKNGEPNGWQLRRHGGDATIDWTTRGAGANNGDFASTNDAAGQVINNDSGNWHHIVGTFNGTLKQIYIDGVLNNTEVVSASSITNSPDSVVFGGRQNPGPTVGNTSFEGLLDNVAIYNHALSPNQVAFLAAGGNPLSLPAPVLFTDKIGVQGGFTVRDAASSVLGSIDSLADADALLAGTNLLSQTIALNVPRINYHDPEGGGGTGNFGSDSVFPNNNNALQEAGQGDQDFAIRATANLVVGTAGVYTFGHNTDDGGRLLIDGNPVFINDVLAGPHDFFGTVNLTAGIHTLDYIFFERGGGAEAELFVAEGTHTSFGPQFSLLTVSTFVNVIPEPASALLALGSFGLLALRRRRVA